MIGFGVTSEWMRKWRDFLSQSHSVVMSAEYFLKSMIEYISPPHHH